jgi:hypothetical protein
MEHGLPLEFPANNSLEAVGTRPMRVVDVPHPSSFFLKKEHEGQMIKDGQDPDRPRAREARGLDRKRLNLK